MFVLGHDKEKFYQDISPLLNHINGKNESIRPYYDSNKFYFDNSGTRKHEVMLVGGYSEKEKDSLYFGTDDLKKFLKDIAIEIGVQSSIDIENQVNEWAITLCNISVRDLKNVIQNDLATWEKLPLPNFVKIVIENKIKLKIKSFFSSSNQTNETPKWIYE